MKKTLIVLVSIIGFGIIVNAQDVNLRQDFVLSKNVEIIVDCYAAWDCAAANKRIVNEFKKLGFCCINVGKFNENPSARFTIAIRNYGGGLRFDINDRNQGDIVVFSKMYSKLGDGFKKFIKDIGPFIVE